MNLGNTYLISTQINSIDTVIVDAFYPYRHDVGIDFWEILKNEESLIRYKNLLEVYLRDVINRKSPIDMLIRIFQ